MNETAFLYFHISLFHKKLITISHNMEKRKVQLPLTKCGKWLKIKQEKTTVKRISKQTLHHREMAIWCKAVMSLEAEPALESCSELQRSFRR